MSSALDIVHQSTTIVLGTKKILFIVFIFVNFIKNIHKRMKMAQNKVFALYMLNMGPQVKIRVFSHSDVMYFSITEVNNS